jgi:hypothetical protein
MKRQKSFITSNSSLESVSLQHFSKELLIEIFSFLDPLSIFHIALTGKQFYGITKGDFDFTNVD